MLTVASIVRNETGRFLPSALEAWQAIADRVLVLDDGSDDGTADVCEAAGAVVHRRDPMMFGTEWLARRELWRLAVRESGWVLWLDADQVMSCDPRPFLKPPVALFRVFDLWSADEYREDAWWHGHARAWWPAVHVPSLPAGFRDEWPERGWHSGHVPMNLPGPKTPMPPACAVLHYAYATPELRAQKAKMYEELAPCLTGAERFHAKTILTPEPHLKPLPFEPKWRLTLPVTETR